MKDFRTRRFLLPTRVLWQHNASNAEVLLRNNWGQALAQPVESCDLKRGSGVLLDFGRELNGSVQLVVGPIKDNRIVRARLRFGESASEAMGEPNNDHANHDFEIQLAPMSSQEYGLSGFRFARLDLVDESLVDEAKVPLVAARAVALEHEPDEVGDFSCSDERLNHIWRVGRETVRLCLQDYIWDGIKRDRLVWMGDLHPEIAVVLRCYGALPIVPQSLDWVRDHTPLPAWMNGIGSYSMWWIILQRDWFWHTGDLKYLEEQRAYLRELLPRLWNQIDESGAVKWRGTKFLDWPSSPNQGAVTIGLHALLTWSLRCAQSLCAALGETELAAQCRQKIALLQRSVPPLSSTKDAGRAGSKQAAALQVLAGLADARTANAQVLSVEPLRGLSTFYGFYTLQSRAQAGDLSGALEVIRSYWGAMLDLGATTFWEDFDLSWLENAGRIDEVPTPPTRDVHFERGDFCYKSWRHSFCHGWAAGPTAFLSERVLGVEVLEAGCKRVKIAPNLGDLQWAEGDFPTPFGPIHLRHEKDATGEIRSQIEAPHGVVIEKSR